MKSVGVFPFAAYLSGDMAPREPHGWTEPRHQLFKINVELEWFEKHAMGRAYQWETAPGDPPRKPAPATF